MDIQFASQFQPVKTLFSGQTTPQAKPFFSGSSLGKDVFFSGSQKKDIVLEDTSSNGVSGQNITLKKTVIKGDATATKALKAWDSTIEGKVTVESGELNDTVVLGDVIVKGDELTLKGSNTRIEGKIIFDSGKVGQVFLEDGAQIDVKTVVKGKVRHLDWECEQLDENWKNKSQGEKERYRELIKKLDK